MKRWIGFEHGMGIGGWLTNYKRFNVLPQEWRFPITIGEMEHFHSYITERDVISCLKEAGIPYCVWNYLSTPNDGNRFSLVDDDNREILSEELGRIIRGQV